MPTENKLNRTLSFSTRVDPRYLATVVKVLKEKLNTPVSSRSDGIGVAVELLAQILSTRYNVRFDDQADAVSYLRSLSLVKDSNIIDSKLLENLANVIETPGKSSEEKEILADLENELKIK